MPVARTLMDMCKIINPNSQGYDTSQSNLETCKLQLLQISLMELLKLTRVWKKGESNSVFLKYFHVMWYCLVYFELTAEMFIVMYNVV